MREKMALRIEVVGDSFCPGVDRAIKLTEQTLSEEGGPVYSAGPLIHNPQVVAELAGRGLEALDEERSESTDLTGARVVVRSHGIDIATERRLEGCGAVLVDATCPTVKRAQQAARELVEQGHAVLVVGSPEHPEVRSIVGRAGAPVAVVEDAAGARRWLEEDGKSAGKVGVVCQTTISRELQDEVVDVLRAALPEVEVRDTLCESVARRRREAVALAGRVDLMLVVGGRTSSNTAKLAGTCSAAGVPTHHIEDPSEIDTQWLDGVESVGIAGGSSTPGWLIEDTVRHLRELSGKGA